MNELLEQFKRSYTKYETKITKNGNGFMIRYHETNIISVEEDTGRVILNTNGWQTISTKKHMNEFLKFLHCHIRQIKGEWFVCTNQAADPIPYRDGMILPLFEMLI